MVQGACDPWWVGLISRRVLEAGGLESRMSVTVCITEVGRLRLPQEQRVVANAMSQCFTVGENGGRCGQDLLERGSFPVIKEVPGISNI